MNASLLSMEGFQLLEATVEDAPAMARLLIDAWADDSWWTLMTSSAPDEKVAGWLESFFISRFSQTNTKTFKIVDNRGANGDKPGKLVAFTNLLWPQAAREHSPSSGKDETGTEAVKEATTKDAGRSNPLPDHIPLPLWQGFRAMLNATSLFGYDETLHFHRRGTFVHVDYQRRGIGKWITRHCNSIADEHGAATFVGCRPKSLGMFQATGFQIIGMLDVRVEGKWEKHDDNPESETREQYPALRRLPGQSKADKSVQVEHREATF